MVHVVEQTTASPPARRSQSTRILLGIALGVAVGVFLGERAAPFDIAADAYVKFLQMTVLPYMTVSLITALGVLRAEDIRTIAVKGGAILLLLWAAAFAVVLLFPLTFPVVQAASFFSTTLVEAREPFDAMALYIPSNPFRALSENLVPAVVVFSVAMGVALAGLQNNERLLGPLQVARQAIARVAEFTLVLTPYGLFAIAASAAGTLSLAQLQRLQGYLVSYVALSLLLSLWILPALIAALTPIRYVAVLARTRDALLTAFVTGSLFVVLPALTEHTKDLVREHTDAPLEHGSMADVLVPASFSFPHAGKLLVLSFVLFAGWYANTPVERHEFPRLAGAGLFALFGNVNGAVPFLLDLLRIPADTFQLFLATSVINARFATLAAAMHTITFGLLALCLIGGLVRVSARKLVEYAVVTLVLSATVVGGTRLIIGKAASTPYAGDKTLMNVSFRGRYPAARVYVENESIPPLRTSAGSRLDQIRARRTLRVGYLSDSLPYAYFNARRELVGFDVEMAHTFARDLNVALEFVPIARATMVAQLDAGACDAIMSGVFVTVLRSSEIRFTRSYLDETLAFVVPDHMREKFSTWNSIRALHHLKIAVPNLQYYIGKVRTEAPEAELITFESAAQVFGSKALPVDAVLAPAERGSAWTLLYPQYSVAVPGPSPLKVPLAYAVAAHDEGLAELMDTWIDLKQKDGTIDALFAYWIEGRTETSVQPRWSVIRDVLHWTR